jgi:hypothetical protein
MVTAGAPNLVMTKLSASSPPGIGSEGRIIPFHSRADPPTAECGQPGS